MCESLRAKLCPGTFHHSNALPFPTNSFTRRVTSTDPTDPPIPLPSGRLTGIGVEDALLKKLLYLAWRFSPVISSYKSITAYHAGDGVWCEVDLLLDEKTPLEHAHDLSETLQYCLEGLPEVDRAFVTCDYKMENPSGHGQNLGS